MITKGIIKSIDLLGNTCTVHIPFFETAGNDPIIETATVSNTPGSYNGYKVGDAVYVAFEDGNMNTPVVIGKLYLGTEKEKADPRGVSNVEESTAAKKATLPADSKLTAQIDRNVPNTTVPYSSLSSIANGLNTLNTNVGQMDRDYGNRFKQIITRADGMQSELSQTAESVVAKVSGPKLKRDANGKIEYDSAGNPIIEDPNKTEGFGWDLQQTYWSVFYSTSDDENGPPQVKEILKADKTGLKVTGEIIAEKGHLGKFIIGEEHENINDVNILESGIYTENYIDCFTQTPGVSNNLAGEKTGTTGVYIGTDGIKLGQNFSVDNRGNVVANTLKINQNQVNELETTIDEINDNITKAETDVKNWLARDVFNIDIDTLPEDTIIADGWISSTSVIAENLRVKAGKIDGTLEAKQIEANTIAAGSLTVGDKFSASRKSNIVKIGSFFVDGNSLSVGLYDSDSEFIENSLGTEGSLIICATGSTTSADIGGSGSKTGWYFTAGQNFGVRKGSKGSELYVNNGKLGGFTVGEKIISSTNSNVGISSDTSPGALAFWAGPTPDNKTFSVTNTGYFTASSGTIGNCVIDENGKLVVPAGNIDGELTAKQINADGLIVTNGDFSGSITTGKATITGGALTINGSTGSATQVKIQNGKLYLSGGKPPFGGTRTSYDLPLIQFTTYDETGAKEREYALYVHMVADPQPDGYAAAFTYSPSSIGFTKLYSYSSGDGTVL